MSPKLSKNDLGMFIRCLDRFLWLEEASFVFSNFGQKLHFLPFFPNHGETSGVIKIDLGVVKTFRERFWKAQNVYFSKK